jgi:hypothetical protein
MKNDFPEVLYFSTTGQKILKNLIGKKITRMFHYYAGNNSEFKEYLNELPNNIPDNQVFSLIEGPLLLEFDSGEEISFFADEQMQSIAFSYERNSNGEYMNACRFYIPQDIDNNPYIDVNDMTFSNDVIRDSLNKMIIDIKLYHNDNIYSPSHYLIRDTIIQFLFDNSTKIALGYNIDSRTVMAVLPWQLVALDVKESINEIDL